MGTWFEIKVCPTLGPEADDDKEVVILGRILRWKDWGIEWEADPKHRRAILDYFGFEGDRSDGLSYNGDKDKKEEEDYELEDVDSYEATIFRAENKFHEPGLP